MHVANAEEEGSSKSSKHSLTKRVATLARCAGSSSSAAYGEEEAGRCAKANAPTSCCSSASDGLGGGRGAPFPVLTRRRVAVVVRENCTWSAERGGGTDVGLPAHHRLTAEGEKPTSRSWPAGAGDGAPLPLSVRAAAAAAAFCAARIAAEAMAPAAARVAESAATEPVETTGGGGGGGGGRLGLRRVLSPPGSPYWGRMRGGGRLESEGEAAACMRVSREGSVPSSAAPPTTLLEPPPWPESPAETASSPASASSNAASAVAMAPRFGAVGGGGGGR